MVEFGDEEGAYPLSGWCGPRGKRVRLFSLPLADDATAKKYPDCRTPDIDVDGDGLEAFCDSDPGEDPRAVDTCIDGDGTEVKDLRDASGAVIVPCTEAMKDGRPRFADGISVELNFETTAIHQIAPPVP